MSEWLKGSVGGIIILGAIGSLAAIAILKLAGFVLERWAKPAAGSVLRRFLEYRQFQRAYLKHLSQDADPSELIVAVGRSVGWAVGYAAFAVSGMTAVVGASILHVHEVPTARLLALAGTIIFFISMWRVTTHVFRLSDLWSRRATASLKTTQ